MGSSVPLVQSIVIESLIISFICLFFTVSMISHSCLVLRVSLDSSVTASVSPLRITFSSFCSSTLFYFMPEMYSVKIVSGTAPISFSSRTCLDISCLFSSVLHLQYPYTLLIIPPPKIYLYPIISQISQLCKQKVVNEIC